MGIANGLRRAATGLVPNDWETHTIGSCFDIVVGGDLVKAQFSAYPSNRFKYPIYSNALTDDGLYGYSSLAGYDGNKITVTARGDVGHAAFRKMPFCAIGRLLILTPKVGMSPYFVASLINTLVSFAFESTGVPQLTGPQISTYEITLPPTLREQEAVAKALSDADAYVSSLEQLLSKKRDIKRGAMQELLTGKKRLPGFSSEWKPVVLGDVAAFSKGKGLRKSAIDPSATAPCVHYGELFTQYGAVIGSVIGRTNATSDTVVSESGDVLMPTSDVTPRGLAKASCIPTAGVILGGDILVIRPARKVLFGPFLAYLIREQQAQILEMVTGTTVFHIYASDLKRFEFDSPDVDEQQAIATILNDMDTEIEALEAKLAKARDLKQGMMQELLTGRIRLV